MNLNGFGQKRRIFSSLLINQIVRFIFHPFLVSLSLFFSPLERTFRISKDNPCDRNVSRASNVYRANWTKMMEEGMFSSLLLPSRGMQRNRYWRGKCRSDR